MRGIQVAVLLLLGATAYGQTSRGPATRAPATGHLQWGYTVYTQKKAPLHAKPGADSDVREHLIVGTKIKIDYCGSIWCAAFWTYDRERSLKKARGYIRLADVGKHAPQRPDQRRYRQTPKPRPTATRPDRRRTGGNR